MDETQLTLSRLAAYVVTGAALLVGLNAMEPTLARIYVDILILMGSPLGWSFTGPHHIVYRGDFGMFWSAGYALRHHLLLDLYNPDAFRPLALKLLQDPSMPLVYPPTCGAIFAAISLVPPTLGFLVFDLAAMVFAAIVLARTGWPGWCIVLALLAPAAANCLMLGQLDLFLGALLIFGLSKMDTNPRLAGVALAFLALKPQFALLVPVAVLVRRRWDTARTGTVSLAILVVLSLLFPKTMGWGAYFHEGSAEMHALLDAPFVYGPAHKAFYSYQFSGISVFWMLRSVHVALGAAYAIQTLAFPLAAAGTWWSWQHPGLTLRQRVLLTVLLTPFVSPYGFPDNLTAWSASLPLLARYDTPWRNAALAWLWAAPAFVTSFTQHNHFLLMPPLLLAALALCLTQQKQPLLAKEVGQSA